MKKLSKKTKILASSLVAVLVSAGIASGATYSLFTSEATNNIAITAGKVQATAKLGEIEIYSADATLTGGEEVPGGETLPGFNHKYYYNDRTEAGSWLAGGKATLNTAGTTLTLDRMVPGDRVDTTFEVTNNSNVDVQYRLVAECLDEEEASLRLFSNLKFTALGETKTNVRKYYTDWQIWEIPVSEEDKVNVTDVKIEMPLALGNFYQDKEVHIALSVEMVQVNAFTTNTADELLVFKTAEVEPNPETPSGMDDVTLTAGGTVSKPQVQVSVPTGTLGEVKAGGDLVAIGDEFNLSVVEDETLPSILVESDEEAKNYDVSLVNQNNVKVTSVNKKIRVSILVGDNKSIVGVYHKGNPIPLYDGVNEGYKYENGYVTYYTDSFSPFTVVFKMLFEGGSGTPEDPYLIKTPEQLVKGKIANACFRLIDDVDLSEVEFSSEGILNYKNSIGNVAIPNISGVVFDGAEHEIKLRLDNEDAEAIFGNILNSTVKNLTIEASCVISGYTYNSTFEDVSFTSSRTMQFTGNTGVFGFYFSSDITLNNVDVYANVVGTSYNGVFFGYNLSLGTVTMNDCSFAGSFISTRAGFIIGNAREVAGTLILNNVVNNGIIKHTNNDLSKNNIISGMDEDKQSAQLKVKVDGKDYVYKNYAYSYNDEPLTFGGTGQYVPGPLDDGLVITVNSDNTFNFTASSNAEVAYYEFDLQTNVRNTSPDGGSGTINVLETIIEDGSESYNTSLEKLYFADGTEPTRMIGLIPVIEIGGVEYYMNTDEYLRADVGGRGVTILLRAYDSDGVLVSSQSFVY